MTIAFSGILPNGVVGVEVGDSVSVELGVTEGVIVLVGVLVGVNVGVIVGSVVGVLVGGIGVSDATGCGVDVDWVWVSVDCFVTGVLQDIDDKRTAKSTGKRTMGSGFLFIRQFLIRFFVCPVDYTTFPIKCKDIQKK
jgi:hypothetical protein